MNEYQNTVNDRNSSTDRGTENDRRRDRRRRRYDRTGNGSGNREESGRSISKGRWAEPVLGVLILILAVLVFRGKLTDLDAIRYMKYILAAYWLAADMIPLLWEIRQRKMSRGERIFMVLYRITALAQYAAILYFLYGVKLMNASTGIRVGVIFWVVAVCRKILDDGVRKREMLTEK